MIWDSIKLFLTGRLFQDTPKVILMSVAGIVATAVVCVALVQFGVAFWIAAPLSALLGGVLQPLLFKNIKYR